MVIKNEKLCKIIIIVTIIVTIIVIINSNLINNLNNNYEINSNVKIKKTRNVSGSSSHNEKKETNRLILLHDDFFKKDVLEKAFDNCLNLNCKIEQFGSKKGNTTHAKLIVYSIPRLQKPNEFGYYRTCRDYPEQLLMAWSMESGSFYPKQETDQYISHFNITGGYALPRDDNINTHIYIPYGPIPFNKTTHYSRTGKFGNQIDIPELRNNSIMWVAGNCENERIGRTDLVKQIMNLTSVHSYGKCLHNKDTNDKDPGYDIDIRSSQKIKLLKQYNFILAIENSMCDDYVTEKLWEPLSTGTIPIYLGAPNINDWLPSPDAIINIANFNSISSLVQYIKRVENEPLLRLKHLQWINQPLPDDFKLKLSKANENQDLFCNICKKLVHSETLSLIPSSTPFKKCVSSKFTLPL